MGKSAFAMFAIDKSPVFQVAQCEPNRYAADVKAATQLMLTGDGKGRLTLVLENFFG